MWEPREARGGHYGAVVDACWAVGGQALLSVSADQTARLTARSGGRWCELARPQARPDVNFSIGLSIWTLLPFHNVGGLGVFAKVACTSFALTCVAAGASSAASWCPPRRHMLFASGFVIQSVYVAFGISGAMWCSPLPRALTHKELASGCLPRLLGIALRHCRHTFSGARSRLFVRCCDAPQPRRRPSWQGRRRGRRGGRRRRARAAPVRERVRGEGAARPGGAAGVPRHARARARRCSRQTGSAGGLI